MDRYNQYRELGDKAITRSTAYRYRDSTISPSYHLNEADHSCITFNDNEADYINDVTNRPMEQHMELDNEQDMMSMEFENDLEYYLHTILLEDRFEKSSQSFQDPKNLEELLNSPTLLEPASSDPVNVSKGELLLMILKFSMNNNLSVTGMTNLFKLINTIFETSIMPNSRYLADKLFNPMDKAEFHAVCPNCTAYIGKFGEIENVRNCRICTLELDLSNPSNTSYFILLNPSSQIKDIISIYQDHYEYVIKERVREPNSISDVYDSKEYIKFVDSLPEQDKSNYISAVFNTDGANKFKCSKYSIWPLFLMLNELPKQERMSKLITCGLFFNKHKPDMTVFLGTFVDMMNRLTKDGIPCVINAKDRLLKLHIISSCVDSVARAPIQGIKQFNGRCACSWCLHPGVWVEDAMKYPLLTTSINPRDHESTINDMMTATPDRPINGIKYPSPLINLTSFNIILGFVPDYMHCCLEGVAKQLTEYHISSMNNDDIREIDSKINKITAPHQISKLSRPLSCRNDWKAREWKNYILYYSVVVLPEHLSRNHYYHWLLFVESLYILLQDKINITELNRADEMLHIFVADTEKYFGQKAMTYNVHQLLHLSTSVLNWGPLWCHSTFSFESGNHILLKAIKSSKGVPYQITRFIQINHTATVLQEHVYKHVSDVVKIYCDDILDSKVQNCCKISNITYFGKGNSIDNILVVNFDLSKDATMYYKIIKDGCLYESESRKKRRSNNSFILLNNNKFARIDKFIVDEYNKREFTICNIIKTRNYHTGYYHMFKIIDEIEANSTIVATSEIKTICIYIDILGIKYILPLPNLLHH